jgi:hypothetical protein
MMPHICHLLGDVGLRFLPSHLTQSVENAALSLSWLASGKASGPDRQYHPK